MRTFHIQTVTSHFNELGGIHVIEYSRVTRLRMDVAIAKNGRCKLRLFRVVGVFAARIVSNEQGSAILQPLIAIKTELLRRNSSSASKVRCYISYLLGQGKHYSNHVPRCYFALNFSSQIVAYKNTMFCASTQEVAVLHSSHTPCYPIIQH